MKTDSRSEFVQLRGLRHHVRRWGDPEAPALFLLHGWLDASATFHDMVMALPDCWQVIAPDWRGFGLSQWPEDGYWFADYLGDLDALLDHYAPVGAVRLIGHSMGAQAASIYAGVRPERIERLALLDALFQPDDGAGSAPKRMRRWLDELREGPRGQQYASFEQLADLVLRLHPRLTASRALRVAHAWGVEQTDGTVRLRSDPKHRRVFPIPYRAAESKAIWSEVTAPTLFIDGGKSELRKWITDQEFSERRACFRNRQQRTIDDSAHMLHFEAPEATAHLLQMFFGG